MNLTMIIQFSKIPLLLIFLMVTSSMLQADTCDYTKDPRMAKAKEACLSTAGKTWDCANNRCIYTPTTTAIKDNQAKCDAIEDAQKKKACFDSLAMGAAKDEGFGNENYAQDAAKNAELLGWANLIWGALMGGAESTCMSVTIMKWTGLAATAGDLYNYFFLSDKVKKLQDEYSKKTVADKSYDAQKEAFDYLLKEQQTIAKVAKQKNIIYTVAAAGYTAAAGMAIYESAMSFTGKAECGTTTDGGAMSCAQVMGKSTAEQKAEKNAMKAERNTKEAQANIAKAENELASMKQRNASPAEIAAKESEIFGYKRIVEANKPATPELATDPNQSFSDKVSEKVKNYGEQVKSNIVSDELDAGPQTKNALLNAGKDSIQPWNLAREAQQAASKASHSDAKKNFANLPQNTRDTMTYNYQKELKDVEALEVQVINTRDQAKKRELARQLLQKWRDIAAKAAEMGESEDAERAAKAAQKWAEYLSAPSAMRQNLYNLFTQAPLNLPVSSQAAFARLQASKNDLHSYIAFYEWREEQRGSNRSFSNIHYQALKSSNLSTLPIMGHGFKSALITLMSFNMVVEAEAAEMGKKIGSLAGNMAISMLKTQALRFALCAVAPQAAMKVSSWLQTPYAVAIMATASAGVNFQLAGVAKKEQQQAEKNAEIIRKLIANFEVSQAAFCPDGRDDIKKPECYCYTDKGERSKHTNSETCQALWAKDDADYFAQAGTDSSNGGCVYLNGKYDLSCSCTKLIDKATGANACLKTTAVSTGTSTLALANAGKINTLTGAVSSLANGSNAAAGVDTASLTNNALSQKANNIKMAEGLNQQLAKYGKAPLKLGTENATRAWTEGLVPSGAVRANLMNLAGKNDAAFSGKDALSQQAKDALINAMKKTGIQYEGGQDKTSKAKSDDYSYLFDSSSTSSNKKVQIFSEEEKKYNYQDNDINTQGGASLFEIISHRFSTSGMRRLFGEE